MWFFAHWMHWNFILNGLVKMYILVKSTRKMVTVNLLGECPRRLCNSGVGERFKWRPRTGDL